MAVGKLSSVLNGDVAVWLLWGHPHSGQALYCKWLSILIGSPSWTLVGFHEEGLDIVYISSGNGFSKHRSQLGSLPWYDFIIPGIFPLHECTNLSPLLLKGMGWFVHLTTGTTLLGAVVSTSDSCVLGAPSCWVVGFWESPSLTDFWSVCSHLHSKVGRLWLPCSLPHAWLPKALAVVFLVDVWLHSGFIHPSAPWITSTLGIFTSVCWLLGIFFLKIVYYMFMDILSAYIFVHHESTWYPRRPEKVLDPLG